MVMAKKKKEYLELLAHRHPNFVPIVNKQKLVNVIKNGEYSVISAGMNPEDREDVHRARKDRDFIRLRTEELRKDLDALGVKYTEVAGSYGGEETSFLISHDYIAKAAERPRGKTAYMVNM